MNVWRGHWNFLFRGFDHFLDRFFGFCTKKLRIFDLVTVAVCGFCSISLSILGKNFRICYSMRFGVFPISLRKICASTISTACTSSLILLAVLIEICFSFAVFYSSLYAFAVSYILQCPPLYIFCNRFNFVY